MPGPAAASARPRLECWRPCWDSVCTRPAPRSTSRRSARRANSHAARSASRASAARARRVMTRAYVDEPPAARPRAWEVWIAKGLSRNAPRMETAPSPSAVSRTAVPARRATSAGRGASTETVSASPRTRSRVIHRPPRRSFHCGVAAHWQPCGGRSGVVARISSPPTRTRWSRSCDQGSHTATSMP